MFLRFSRALSLWQCGFAPPFSFFISHLTAASHTPLSLFRRVPFHTPDSCHSHFLRPYKHYHFQPLPQFRYAPKRRPVGYLREARHAAGIAFHRAADALVQIGCAAPFELELRVVNGRVHFLDLLGDRHLAV